MNRCLNLLILLLICFTLSGCATNSENIEASNKDGNAEVTLINNEVIDKLAAINTIIVKEIEKENIKTITDTNKIDKIINLISSATNINHDITYEGPRYYLEMYNTNNQLIDVVEVFNENIGFKSDTTNRYKLNMEELKEIIIERN